MNKDLRRSLDAYERTARTWAAEPNSATRNATFRRNHIAFKAIRDFEPGQELIRRLAANQDPSVSLLGATHCLWFDPDYGRGTLETLSLANTEVGLSAAMTIIQHKAGKLDLDW